MRMRTGMLFTAVGLGMAAGATAALMLPRQSAVRRTIQKAADTASDAVCEAVNALEH